MPGYGRNMDMVKNMEIMVANERNMGEIAGGNTNTNTNIAGNIIPRAEFISKDGTVAVKKVDMSEIHINDLFAETIPAKKKLDNCREYWDKYQRQDRFIVLDFNDTLIDGYVQYLVLCQIGAKEAEVMYSEIPGYKRESHYRNHNCNHNEEGLVASEKLIVSGNKEKDEKRNHGKQEVTYIYGRHVTDYMPRKEYIWKIPKTWTDFAEEVRIGDDILCPTCYGLSHVMVTRIKKAYGIPPKKVKRIASKKIWRVGILENEKEGIVA